MPDLDQLFDDADEQETEPTPEITPEVTEPEPEGEKPAVPEKETQPVEPPSTGKPDEAEAYKAAMLEERRKRQDIERRLQEIEKAKPEEKKDFWADPEGVIAAKVGEIEQRFTYRFLQQSESHARKRYEDYEEKIVAFQEAMERDPSLHQRMLASEDPADFAYSTGKTYLFTKDAPTIDALEQKMRSKVEADLREQIRKELEEEYRTKNLKRVPESLSEQTGATTRQTKVEGGPTPIGSIFND